MNHLKLSYLAVSTLLSGAFVASSVLVPATAFAQTPAPAPDLSAPPAPVAGDPSPPAPAPEPAAAPAPEPAKPAPPSPQPVVSKWKATLYGFVEFNIMHDSTQSFPESVGATLIARKGSYAYEHSRTQFTARNSRFGVRVNAPDIGEVKTTAVLELDFFGVQPPGLTSASAVSNGAFRMRQANIKLETPWIDVLAGQTYHVFGSQPFFSPMSVSFFPVMNQVFGRQPQLRLSKTIKSEPVNAIIDVAAVKPPQINSATPDFQGSLRLGLNGWKGIHTLGASGYTLDPLTLAVSGIVRKFKVQELSAAPADYNSKTGYGISAGAMIPVIPATSLDDMANALTLTGTYFSGTGIADQLGVAAGVPYPMVTNSAGMQVAFTPDIDPGIVTYDVNSQLQTINWAGFMLGVQYYLPPSGHMQLSANYTQGEADQLTADKGWGMYTTFFRKSRYIDANFFIDVVAPFRVGLSYQNSQQTYADDQKVTNNRYEAAIYCVF
jgi:hypothetical protein